MTRTTYCLTGTFDIGSIDEVSGFLERLNCRVLDEVSPKIDYLLIGRKRKGKDVDEAITEACCLIEEGRQITLIHESHWVEMLSRDTKAWELLALVKAEADSGMVRKPRRTVGPPALWEGSHLVRFRYRNAKGEETDREVKLHRVTGENGQPEKLSGFCLYRGMNRTFIAANIVSAEVIDAESGEVGELKELLARL